MVVVVAVISSVAREEILAALKRGPSEQRRGVTPQSPRPPEPPVSEPQVVADPQAFSQPKSGAKAKHLGVVQETEDKIMLQEKRAARRAAEYGAVLKTGIGVPKRSPSQKMIPSIPGATMSPGMYTASPSDLNSGYSTPVSHE